MQNTLGEKPRKLFIGDVHGKIDQYWKILQKHPDMPSIQVGDFGFSKHHLWHLENIDSTKHKINFGNHDDYYFLHHAHSLGDASFMDDVMTIRGADSIDKHIRTEGVDWWREEELEYKFFLQLVEFVKYHRPKVIVSHDCPQSIREDFFSIYDKSRTSQGLQAILEAHRPEYWIFGHHHKRVDVTNDGTRFICLEELGTFIL